MFRCTSLCFLSTCNQLYITSSIHIPPRSVFLHAHRSSFHVITLSIRRQQQAPLITSLRCTHSTRGTHTHKHNMHRKQIHTGLSLFVSGPRGKTVFELLRNRRYMMNRLPLPCLSLALALLCWPCSCFFPTCFC